MNEMMKRLKMALSKELVRQYDANPKWDEAKDVVEDLDLEAFARAVIEAIEASGHRIVPRVPTTEMMAAVLDGSRANGSPLSKGFADSWVAAVAAAPSALTDPASNPSAKQR